MKRVYTHSNDIENLTELETTVFMVEGQGTFNTLSKGKNLKILKN